MSFKVFKEIVYRICRELNYSVIQFYEADITPNFHTAHVRMNEKDLFVLCSHENHWAYSSFYSTSECRLEFLDVPNFSKLLFDYYDIQVHSTEELNSMFSNKYNCLESDIKYWKPRTEGDGLFNWWD